MKSMRILIVHPEGNINNNPNLTAISETLHENGFQVDILAKPKAHVYQEAREFYRALFLNKMDFLYESIISKKALTKKLLNVFLRWLGRAYCLIIGVDAYGIILASAIAEAAKKPLGLISYEIFFSDEMSEYEKGPEIKACSALKFAITQDPVRARLLSRENKIPIEKIFSIPVSGRRFDCDKFEKNYLRKKYNIPEDKKIALCIGSLENWAGRSLLLEDLETWPDNWILVLHGRYGADNSISKAGQLLNQNIRRKIIISQEVFSRFSDLYKMVISADLGIGLYYPDFKSRYTGKNLEHVGLSSGKIATYLACGVPVLTNNIGIYSVKIKGHGLGYVLSENHRPSDVLRKIDIRELQKTKTNCTRFFNEEICFDKYVERFINLIKRSSDCADLTSILAQYRLKIFTGTLNRTPNRIVKLLP